MRRGPRTWTRRGFFRRMGIRCWFVCRLGIDVAVVPVRLDEVIEAEAADDVGACIHVKVRDGDAGDLAGPAGIVVHPRRIQGPDVEGQ